MLKIKNKLFELWAILVAIVLANYVQTIQENENKNVVLKFNFIDLCIRVLLIILIFKLIFI